MPIEDFVGKIIPGDTLKVLETMPNESIDMVITSPPYYALRNYGVDGQLGLEKTFDEYKVKILEITAELKRVLKKSGQLWWNMGDVYATHQSGGKNSIHNFRKPKLAIKVGHNLKKGESVQEKCLIMMPERIALEMIDKQSWILRNKIKWVKQVLLKKENITKGSVMPTSVKDRFNESGEELYFFVKNKKYYSDLDAVRLPNQVLGITDFREDTHHHYTYQGKFTGNQNAEMFNSPRARTQRKSLEERLDDTKNKDQKFSRTYNIKKLLSEVRLGIKPNTGMVKRENIEILTGRRRDVGLYDRMGENVIGKNLPSVWLVGSEPHNFQKEVGSDCDHFATFPQALLDIPIRFGCPPGGIILDPFMGAGTTAIVAKKLGRNFIGIELNPKYIELAEKRIRLECPPTLF